MKLRLFITKCSAFFLLLLFLQKSGAGLLIHNSKHNQHERKESPNGQDKKGNTLNFTCSCLDEFLTPFAETESLVVSGPCKIVTVHIVTYNKQILFSPRVHSLLRGPPVNMI